MTQRTMILALSTAVALAGLGCEAGHIDEHRQKARTRLDESRAEIAMRLAHSCYEKGELGRARDHVSQAIRSGSKNAALFALAGRLAAEGGELDEARGYARMAISLDAEYPDAHFVLGTVEQALGRTDVALAQFARALELAPKNTGYALARAELLVGAGRAREAEACLNEAIAARPGAPELHQALGDVLSRLGRHKEAIGSYRIALRLEPKREGLDASLATALYFTGQYREAEPLLAKLVVEEPVFASRWARQMHADCLVAMGRVNEARTEYRALHQSAPEAVGPVLSLAKCDVLEDDFAAARERLEAVLAIQPKNVEANALMGLALVNLDRKAEAVPYLRLALADETFAGRLAVRRLLARTEK